MLGGFYGNIAGIETCPWDVPPVFGPLHPVAGQEFSSSSNCNYDDQGRAHGTAHNTNHVAVSGQQQVKVDGKSYGAWVLHRTWAEDLTGSYNSKTTGVSDEYWVPELQHVVFVHMIRTFTPPGGATTTHDETIVMRGYNS